MLILIIWYQVCPRISLWKIGAKVLFGIGPVLSKFQKVSKFWTFSPFLWTMSWRASLREIWVIHRVCCLIRDDVMRKNEGCFLPPTWTLTSSCGHAGAPWHVIFYQCYQCGKGFRMIYYSCQSPFHPRGTFTFQFLCDVTSSTFGST